MNLKHQLPRLAVLVCAALHFLSGTTRAQTPAFTYPGRLDEAGTPANGLYDLRLAVYDAETGGSTIGGALIQGLNQKVEERHAQLTAENAALKEELTALRHLVERLGAQLNRGAQ